MHNKPSYVIYAECLLNSLISFHAFQSSWFIAWKHHVTFITELQPSTWISLDPAAARDMFPFLSSIWPGSDIKLYEWFNPNCSLPVQKCNTALYSNCHWEVSIDPNSEYGSLVAFCCNAYIPLNERNVLIERQTIIIKKVKCNETERQWILSSVHIHRAYFCIMIFLWGFRALLIWNDMECSKWMIRMQ